MHTTVGCSLRVLRVLRGMAQADLASESGMSPATLSNIETGRVKITPETRCRLASAFTTARSRPLGEPWASAIGPPERVLDGPEPRP